ncbi:MAG TPA: hypothetical protein VIN08_09275 [Ohtaekwangia sp.]|uniref:hypothetical protein n=1 Tax=Ohtaekwangia sp. TaxID=2066019 RepID=UPI002F94E653
MFFLVQAQPYEGLKNITEIVHNVTVILALIVGAIWTLYTFSSLRARQKAKFDLFQQAVLDITIDCKQQHVDADDEDYIVAQIKIVNKGNRNTFLNFEKKPSLEIYKVRFDKDGISYLEKLIEQKNVVYKSVVLRSGATCEIPVIVKIPSKGFYTLSFRVHLNEIEFGEHLNSGGPNLADIYWRGSASIFIV